MEISLVSTILVIVFGFFMNYERWVTSIGLGHPLISGIIVGLICGDLKTGLFIGGTMQLMTLGVTSFGGASLPDYTVATIISTYLTIATGLQPEMGITLGIPIAIIMVQIDVLNKTLNIVFQHRAEKDVEEGNFHKIGQWQWLGNIFTMASTGIPIMLGIIFGQSLVEAVFSVIPTWLLTGLQVAGGILPVVGLGLLLRTMSVKKNLSALIVGFVLSAFLKLSVIGIALLGLAWALVVYNQKGKEVQVVTVSTEGGIEGDE